MEIIDIYAQLSEIILIVWKNSKVHLRQEKKISCVLECWFKFGDRRFGNILQAH